ncbi:MAG: hypothetical protein H6835_08245 [Planctomycetes bacterium]|nr:hypothetical protein [Planctomycetota bacterium]
MWPGQEVFDVTVTVAARPFGREVEPLRTKVELKRKPPPTPAPTPQQEGGSQGKSKR